MKKKTAAAAVAVVVGAAESFAADWTLRVDAPPTLAAAVQRVEGIDSDELAAALEAAGLALPAEVHVTLVPEDHRLALQTPRWVAGLAAGTHDIAVFPERISSYPYGSLEAVVRHEVVHLALSTRAAGRPLPRWFHEGTAVSVESGWSTTDRVRLLLATLSGPAIDDVSELFESPREPAAMQAYLLAAALVEELRRVHGSTLPGRIAGRVGQDTPFGLAFEIETGRTPNQAAAVVWRSYRRWTSWVPAVTSPSSTWSLILGLAFLAFFARLWRRSRQRREWEDRSDDADGPADPGSD